MARVYVAGGEPVNGSSGCSMPHNYFEIRTAIEEAPATEMWDDLITDAMTAIDACDWTALREVALEAIRRKPCPSWKRRLLYLLDDPVFAG